MIGFDLSEEQKQFRDLAHDFAEREMRPAAAQYDESEEYPWDVLRKAQEIGLLAYCVPEEYGGAGLASGLTGCIISCLAKNRESMETLCEIDLRMPPGNDQGEIRVIETGFDEWRVQMPHDMVYAYEGDFPGGGQSFREGQAHVE